MKSIITAVMQTVILIVALLITALAIPKLAGDDNRFDKYIAENSTQTVTTASALDIVKDGEKATYKDIDNSIKTICSKVTFLQKPVNSFLNKEISFKQAKFVGCYWLTALIAGALCWLFAAGFPFRVGRKGFNIFGSVYNQFSKVVLLEDEMTREEYEVDLGMTIWGPLFIILLALRMTFAIIWGFILPLVIIGNLIIGIIRIIGRVLIISARGAKEEAQRLSRAKQTDKTTYSLYPTCGFFRIELDQDHTQGVFLRNYWNAVAAKTVLDSEALNKDLDKDTANENIRFGDYDKKNFYETYRLLTRLKGRSKPETKQKKAIINAARKEGGYEYKFDLDQHIYHVYMTGSEAAKQLSHADVRSRFNTAMLLDVLDYDRKGKQYEMRDYNNLRVADDDEFDAKISNFNTNLVQKFGRDRYDQYFNQHKDEILAHRRNALLSEVGSDD